MISNPSPLKKKERKKKKKRMKDSVFFTAKLPSFLQCYSCFVNKCKTQPPPFLFWSFNFETRLSHSHTHSHNKKSYFPISPSTLTNPKLTSEILSLTVSSLSIPKNPLSFDSSSPEINTSCIWVSR